MLKPLWSRPLGPDTDLLKIAGIDMSLGLKQVGGKRERYESLLRKFASRQAGTVTAIRAALAAGDAASAEREAHSLKGAAATLGALALSEAASNTETALKAGVGVEQALGSLSNSLGTVVEAIQSSLPD
jgi:HPt (histidine-containing phosphotransfer) domain-containing protein